jgi:hypothetical protein
MRQNIRRLASSCTQAISRFEHTVVYGTTVPGTGASTCTFPPVSQLLSRDPENRHPKLANTQRNVHCVLTNGSLPYRTGLTGMVWFNS